NAAGTETGLGVRTNYPRIYIVASLAGGTGSGMLIDFAYLAREALRRLGYERPEVIGVLLLPPAKAVNPETTGWLANSYAALTELHHFTESQAVYYSRYMADEPSLRDAGPPFVRSILLQSPELPEGDPLNELINLASTCVFHETCTPLGKAADA